MNPKLELIDTIDTSLHSNKLYGITGKYVYPQKWGNEFIKQNLKKNQPFSAGKIGGIECSAMQEFANNGNNSNWFKPMWWSTLSSAMHNNAGIYPQEQQFLTSWAHIFSKSLMDIDLLGVWSPQFEEDLIVSKFAPFSNLCATRALEPFYHKEPWTQELKNKKVLVISPFTNSIEKQYKQKKLIWSNLEEKINPDFDIKFLKCPLSPALVKPKNKDWKQSLIEMQNEVKEIDFDVALIGSGAYSLPLCSFIRNNKKTAIHLGGGLQILFGVLGRRWLNHEIINKFFNKHWIFPSKEETPSGTEIIEGACYWK